MKKTRNRIFGQKSLIGFMSVAMLSVFASCSSLKDDTQPQPVNGEATLTKAPEFFVSSGNNWFVGTRVSTRATSGLTYERIPYHWNAPIDIFKHFPEFITPEGYYENFLYVSNGEPFDLVMLYANGGYRHDMGIYWYENGEVIEQELWKETADEAKNTWVNFNGTDSKGEISRKADEAGAYTITLPKGTRFGFYCHSTYNGNEIKEGIPTPLPYGPIVDYTYKFYTEKEKNWSYDVAVYDKYAEKGLTETQAMTTTANGWTVVGFEDVSITYPSCDRDYNDCVFAINPAQVIEGSTTDNAVEVNLSVNDAHEQGDYIATKLSIHVRAITDADVFIPVPQEYYCQVDDMYVSASHKYEEIVYNTTPQYVEMKIGNTTVQLTVTYSDKGINVTTSGVNEEVINYCDATYKDGITFEVWNYFNDNIDRSALKTMLDKSTVTFIGKQPESYINAFGRVNGAKNPWDCTVTPANTSYEISTEDPAQYNVVYVFKQ